jgi:hypothetical protein
MSVSSGDEGDRRTVAWLPVAFDSNGGAIVVARGFLGNCVEITVTSN